MDSTTLFYVHDPMCSWCWGYRPVRDQLRASLPAGVNWKNLLGGLAPDSDVPMPRETRDMIMNHWRNIRQKLGTPFNFDFWDECNPRRSTYPACRAVLVARMWEREEAMIDAIQRAYYLRAMNPSNNETLIRLAEELGLDGSAFGQQLTATETNQALTEEIGQARAMGVSSFPSLLLRHGNSITRIPHDYQAAQPTLSAIALVLGDPIAQ